METDRRGFLRLTAGGAALLLARRGEASGAERESALGIHRETRNTPSGAIGVRLRASFRPLPPFKPYPGLPRVALPVPSWEAGRPLFSVARVYAPARAFAREGCSREELSRILLLANGVTQPGPGAVLRAAPSAGALYSGEVYAVIERVTGLAPGVYSYEVASHALVRLREGPFLAEVARAIEGPPDAAGAAAALLLTNVFARYGARYANRGYRYALIDSGHIGENLRLAASEIGLGEAAPPRFEDDRLNTLLGVDGREEAVCAVHLVGRPAAVAAGVAPRARALVERQTVDATELWSGLPAPERYHEATKLVPDAGGSETQPPAAQGADPQPAADADATASEMTAHAAIRVRRSAQHFASAPMQRADLLAILALARGNPALRRSGSLDLYAVAHRVADTPAGLYRYDPTSHRLEPLHRGDLTNPLIRACLGQKKSGQAATALIGVARVAEASAHGGARSYRDLLLDAGATAQRVYLGAEALGLAARNLAAFYDDELDALLGLDGEREVAVHLTAVGAGD